MNCQSSCSGDNAKITVEDKGDGTGSRHWWQLLVLWEVIAGHCSQGGLWEERAGELHGEAVSSRRDSGSWGLARPPWREGHPWQGCRFQSHRGERRLCWDYRDRGPSRQGGSASCSAGQSAVQRGDEWREDLGRRDETD